MKRYNQMKAEKSASTSTAPYNVSDAEEDQEWQIRSVASGEVVATYNGTARSVLWPTGLRTWNIAPLACQALPPSNTADLILSRWGLMTVEPESHR